MMIEFRNEGILVVPQSPIKVFYEGEIIGEYYADMMVDNKVIVDRLNDKYLLSLCSI